MRTLVVFTDFTLKAENTVFYALALASLLRSDIMLCHVLETTGQFKYTENDERERNDAIDDMVELMQRSRRRVMQFERDQYRPMVECSVKSGTLSTALDQIANIRNVVMAVMSTRCTDKLTALLLGSSTNGLINHARYPVLLVPYEARFTGFKNLVFATDLNSENLPALDSLCDMATYANSEIIIAHVRNKGLIDHKSNTNLQRFFNNIGKQIAYPQKRYKVIKDVNILRGIKKIPQKLNIDVLAIVHQKRNYLQRLFNHSISLAVANYSVKPVIIFPPGHMHKQLLSLNPH